MKLKFLKIKALLKCIKIFGIIEFLKHLFLAYFSKNKTSFKDFLGITIIIKNEAPYIEEWLEFHKIMGVTKFYIYDNESTDNIKEILLPYIKDNSVKYKYIKGKGVQAKAYNNSIIENKNDVKYMAFIDADEFITPTKLNSVVDYLKEKEKTYGNFDAININWLLHGFCGHYKKPKGLVVENFQKCDFRVDRNNHIKTILNPRSVIMTYHPHFFIHKIGSKIINTKNEEMYGPFCKPNYEDIIIHHYFTKSYEEHKERYKKGKADLSKTFLLDWCGNELSYDKENSISRFIPQLKAAINSIKSP